MAVRRSLSASPTRAWLLGIIFALILVGPASAHPQWSEGGAGGSDSGIFGLKVEVLEIEIEDDDDVEELDDAER